MTEYIETEQQEKTRRNSFTCHAPNGDQVERMAFLRSQADSVALGLNAYCPPSRELALAMTKLEEVVMWGNAAIARNEPKPDKQSPNTKGPS